MPHRTAVGMALGLSDEEITAGIASIVRTVRLCALSAAIQFIQKATKNLLLDFFASEYTIGEIYSELANLSTRLIIYTQKDAYTEKEYLQFGA